MNSELKDKVYKLPPHLVTFLKNQPEIEGLKRNKNLLEDGTVTYGQLKRILHDLKKMNKLTDLKRYNYYGGDEMLNWGLNFLNGERGQVKNSKEATKIANDIAGLSGERENPSLKKHTKNTLSPKISVNDITKPNSEKFTNSSMFSAKSLKLTEQIKRIKKLMT